jgi:hypothetical protein
MAVVERQRVPTRPERAIFVAADGRRARLLRRAALVAALLACLWVVGLGLGMLGFGSLPGVSVVKEQIDGIGGGTGPQGSQPTDEVSPATRRSTPAEPRPVSAAQATPAVRSRARARTRPVTSRPVTRPDQATTAPPVAQTPVNPATRERGWSRRGSTAPPGRVRKTLAPPPATRGQRRGQDPTAPRPVKPGQEKKAQLPPLPPPKQA